MRTLFRIAAAVAFALLTGVVAPEARALQTLSAPDELFRVKDARLTEISGLAVSDAADTFYAVQDAGHDPELFVLDDSGRAMGVVTVPFPDTDWEDVALFRRPGRTGRIYIADTGDASLARAREGKRARTDFRIIRLDEPEAGRPQTLRRATSTESFAVRLTDSGAHNLESILVDPADERVYLVDKMPPRGGAAATVWQGPAVLRGDGENLFQKVASLPIRGISSASFSPGGRFVAVRDATKAYVWPVQPGGLGATLTAEPQVLTLPKQPQGESLAFTADGTALVVTSEGKDIPVLRVPLPAALQDPLYPFTPDERPDHAAGIAGGFVAVALLAIGAAYLVRRRALSAG